MLISLVAHCKTCTKCRETKPLSEFNKDKYSKDGLNRQCGVCKRKYRQAWRAAHGDQSRAYRLYYRYGIDDALAWYDETLEAQGGGCAICGMTPEDHGKRLCADHDHETDEVRGLLCHKCNSMLGHADDSPDRLRGAANYLEAHRC